MNSRPVLTTFTRFTLRFAALIALTLIVLASVSVGETRSSDPAARGQSVNDSSSESATAVNSRRYPLQHPVPQR